MINIEIKKAEKVSGVMSAFIQFPYDNDLISIIRAQSSRHWHPDQKVWEVPATRLSALLKTFSPRQVTIQGEYTYEAPLEEIELPPGFQFTTKPFMHQIEGFRYGLKHDNFLLGDDPGLGKTKQVIDIAVAKKLTKGYQYCLIIAGVNGLKWNWEAEIKTHSQERSHILGIRSKKSGKAYVGTMEDRLADLHNLPDAYFLITNIETLRDDDVCNKLKDLCARGVIGMVAIDEIHMCKNPTSQQGKAILKLKPETRIAMTGTAIMNSPLDLYIIMKWLGVEKHAFHQFKNHYCVMGGYGNYQVVGYRNLQELREMMETHMLRRLKKEVMDLPEKISSIEYIEMTPKQSKIYNQVLAEIKADIDKIILHPNPLVQLIRLRQATGYTGILSSTIKESAKLDRLEEIVAELVDAGQKCIIYSNWTDITDAVAQRLQPYNPALITGQVKDSPAERDRFMQDPTCLCAIGTIGAMGTGYTLTAASTVIFMDSPWNRAKKDQAEDRLHRIGTTSTVNIITLVCKNTIDERIEQLVNGKGAMADLLVDGKIDGVKQKEIVDFLIN